MAAFTSPPPLPPDPPACYGTVTHGGITHEVADAFDDVSFGYSQTDDVWISSARLLLTTTDYYLDPEDGDDEAELGWPFCFWWPLEPTPPTPEEVGVGLVAKARLRYPVGEDTTWGGGT